MREARAIENADTAAMNWIRIIRGEYLEMPDLQLTRSEATRLWGLDDRWCAMVLSALVNERFLRLKPDGRYARSGA